MARLISKKSTVAAKVPLPADLEIGELAVNTADAKLFTKHNDGSIKQIGIASDDARLTDAREWTATTVSQAEAEAGTASTRRAWTAQRVFQAAAAWWTASAMKTKLDGIAVGATANATNAQLRDRTTHTGAQPISTVTGLQTALDGKINSSERGVSGGVATLDQFALIPASQLPSYVDDVLEFQALANFPATGEGGKIYIAINQASAANPTRQYRWTGSVYAEINPSPGTTDALVEGSTNLYFSEGRVRNTVLTGLSFASAAAVAATDSVLSAFGKVQARLSLLGTAANEAAQISTGDLIAGRLMRTGAGGWLGTSTPFAYSSGTDTETIIEAPTALYAFGSGGYINPAPGVYFNILHLKHNNTCADFSFGMLTNDFGLRRGINGVYGPWVSIWHTGNFNPATKQDVATVIAKTATSQAALLTDAGQYQRFTNASASTYTIAPQSSVAWADNTELTIRRATAANLTLIAGSGVTLNAPSGGTLVLTNNMTVTLKRVATNVWDVIGQTVPA